MRLQLALNARNLDEAIDFYSKMFGAPVHKRRPGYAKPEGLRWEWYRVLADSPTFHGESPS
jgi:catechol 2,3-dioxygenase-like lactoylglutathione lyase family enzyme